MHQTNCCGKEKVVQVEDGILFILPLLCLKLHFMEVEEIKLRCPRCSQTMLSDFDSGYTCRAFRKIVDKQECEAPSRIRKRQTSV